MIVEALFWVVKNGHDVIARGEMLIAAAMSGVACEKDLGATNSLAHPLAGVAGMHHGAATAVCLPHVMHFNAQRKPGMYRRVGQACGLEVANVPAEVADFRTVEFIRKFITDLGVKPGLHHYGVRETQMDLLAARAFADASHLTNPVPVNSEDLKSLYRAAL
jgi:alcohol dehydrogenase class IV